MAAKQKPNFERIAEVYHVLGSARRLEVLAIIKDGERSVDEMAKIIKIRKANLSQHLALLRLNRFVKTKRVGQRIFYRLADPSITESLRSGDEIQRKVLPR